jgi:hypothetical protein
MQKTLFIFIFLILLNSESLFSQFSENLNHAQFNKVISVFKGRRSDFGAYYLGNFPCTACSGGYFYIKDDNSLIASYSYKGLLFTGILKNSKLVYNKESNSLDITSDWINTGKNGGQMFAKVSFEYSFNSDYYKWNTLLRYRSGNTEMVAYYTLSQKQLEDVYSFLVKETRYSFLLFEEEEKKILAKREKFISDSLLNERKEIEKIEKDRLERLQDSLILVKDDSLRRTLIVGSTYKDGIVFQIDSNFHGKLIKKSISPDLHYVSNSSEIEQIEIKFSNEDGLKTDYQKRFDYFKLHTNIKSINNKIKKNAPDWRMMKFEEARALLDILQTDENFYKLLENLYPPSLERGWLSYKYVYGLKNKWIYSCSSNNDPILINFDDKELNVNDENTLNSYKGLFKIANLMFIITDIRIIPVKDF